MKNSFEKFEVALEKCELSKLKGGGAGWTGCVTEHQGTTFNWGTQNYDLEMLGDSDGDPCE
jgi:hypothetical protein